MPRHVATLPSTWSADRLFTYMCDFTNAQEWDPSVEKAERVDTGPVRLGSRFNLVVRNGRSQLALGYEVTRLTAETMTLAASTGMFRSVDTIRVTPDDQGSILEYDATLAGRGLAVLLTPLLGRPFTRMFDAAEAQLRKVVQSPR